MRALVFASLMPSGSEGERVLRELPFAASSDAPVLKRAQRLLGSHYPSAPKVLDIFGGGGTIPYEAASLGAEVSSLDYNPLSVFIQKANLECAYDALDSLSSSQLASVVRDSGTRILEAVRSATDDLFPLRSSDASRPVFAYFWSYRLRCVGCGYAFLLTKRPWLSRKAGKRLRMALVTRKRRVQRGLAATVLHAAPNANTYTKIRRSKTHRTPFSPSASCSKRAKHSA
jgi:putative DNA methylase